MQTPQRVTLEGRWVKVAPLEPASHGRALFEGSQNDELWTYMWDGPFRDRAAFDAMLAIKAASENPLYFALIDQPSGVAAGYASYMRITPVHRVIEVGDIVYLPEFQRTRGATEAMYLMARYVFEELGYRRYEWKCNALNEPSRRAALRYGFRFEGIFRQHMLVKGKNRDTAWFAMLDGEWPERKANFERWLDDRNFDADGRQKVALSELNRAG